MNTENPNENIAIRQALTILMVEDDPSMQQRLQHIIGTYVSLAKPSNPNKQPINKTNYESATASDHGHADATLNTRILITKDTQQTLNLLQQPQISDIHLVLLDLGLPDGHGIDLIALLRQHYPNVIILVITVCATHEVLLNCLKAGANGYLLKERDDLELAVAIKNVLNGAMPIDPFMAKMIIEIAAQSDNMLGSARFSLSEREIEILKLVTQGLSNRDIADQLHLSRYTIDSHIRNIYAKLAVNNRSKAIAAVNKFKLF